MRYNNYFSQTQRDIPSNAEIVSHQLMLKAGLIKRLAAGLYSWTPMGFRVLKKVEGIVRKHMDASGAYELIMPMVQPAELWQESGRWEQYGPELLRLNDRHQRDFCLGPTHEEVITDMVRTTIKSYKQLPVNLYQIQNKFRDEIRPRFGIMRSREFLMKDAYSFHLNEQSLQETYDVMYQTYTDIFTELGLEFRAVKADSGSIGGNLSHEFHVLADSGEDAIAFSDQSLSESQFAANIETVESLAPANSETTLDMLEKIATPNQKTIDTVCELLDITPQSTVKTLIINADGTLMALVLRGDHQLSMIKAQKNLGLENPITLGDIAQIKQQVGCNVGSIGPIGLNLPIVVDRSAAAINNFVSGANEDGYHYTGCNWQRDIGDNIQIADIREIEEGDLSPDGSGKIIIRRGIEVGHIFQLGDKYSTAMNTTVQDENGNKTALQMGCYGIGISRIVAAAIEQNNDEKGIIWPSTIAPFQVVIVPININKSDAVRDYCEDLYKQLLANNVEVLLMDQPGARLGELLNDSELFGIPHRVVIGQRGLDNNQIEYTRRGTGENSDVDSEHLLSFLLDVL